MKTDSDLFEGADSAEDIPGPLGDDQEFFIPVHDFVRFTPDEVEIINHPALQRLGRIYQLGQAYLVYRGATHKRFEHVLGTVHIAQKMINALHANFIRYQNQKPNDDDVLCPIDNGPTEQEIRFIRLGALLHDVGHLPAGHTLEDELCLLDAQPTPMAA